MKTVVVEFFGLPGAGKSTVQSEIKKKFKARNISVVTKEDLSSWLKKTPKLKKLYLLTLNINTVLILLFNLVRTSKIKQWSNIDYLKRVKSMLLNFIYIKRFISIKTPQVLLLDQSYLQVVWSLWYGSSLPDKKYLNRMLSIIYSQYGNFIYKYIYLEIDYKIASSRIANRIGGESRFDQVDDLNIVECRLEKGVELMEYLKEEVEKNNYDLLVVNSNRNSEEMSNKVIDWLFINNR